MNNLPLLLDKSDEKKSKAKEKPALITNYEKEELIKELKKVSDFRVDEHKIEHPLYEILFMTLLGLLKGYLTYKELHGWM